MSGGVAVVMGTIFIRTCGCLSLEKPTMMRDKYVVFKYEIIIGD